MRIFLQTLLLIPYLLSCSILFSQSFTPGQSYFGTDDYVEYIAGNLPLVISAPHGGYLEPQEIPDRSCTGCVYSRDSYTQELTREILDSMFAITGCYPHVIINRLHRKKLDANREIVEAAGGDQRAEKAWEEYHAFIDSAKAAVMRKYGKGLFLDMHGHAHSIQRIELGYLLSRSQLQLPDNVLNTPNYVNRSSIRHLVSSNLQGHNHANLLRGAFGMGTLFGQKNFPSVPSLQDPFPMGSDPFFSGGYNTRRHGSRDSGRIDAIQLECYRDLRFTEFTRRRFAGELVQSAIVYLETYYFQDFSTRLCRNNTGIGDEMATSLGFQLYPNPAHDKVFIQFDRLQNYQIEVYNMLGQRKFLPFNQLTQLSIELNISELISGIYWICIKNIAGASFTKKLIIN